jgi:hypothetical protein
MGKYTRQSSKPTSRGPHPIWNGLGCLMLIIIPIISIAIAIVVVGMILDYDWPFPYQLLGYPRFPSYFYSTIGLAQIFSAIHGVENLYAYMAVASIIAVILGGIISILYALIYRFAGPSRYGPTDSPPIKMKITKKQR